MGTFGYGWHDRADDSENVIRPQPSRYHAFQRNALNTRCGLDGCGEKAGDYIHTGSDHHYWRKPGWWRFVAQF